MEDLFTIKEMIGRGETDSAIEKLMILAGKDLPGKDEVYYLLGNAWRKKGNWQLALNNYLSAIEINPDSPATEARKMLMDILNFYNKDMYNQ